MKPTLCYIGFALVVVIVAMLTGCVHVKYGEASYSRLGNMAIEDVQITTPEGMSVHIGKSNAETHLAEAVADIAATARQLAK